MLRKITIHDTAVYFIDSNIPEDEAVEMCLEWWAERIPTVEAEGPLAPCETGIRCPYNHNCSECK